MVMTRFLLLLPAIAMMALLSHRLDAGQTQKMTGGVFFLGGWRARENLNFCQTMPQILYEVRKLIISS